MVSLVSFVTLSLASMAVVSVVRDMGGHELGMESNLEKRAGYDCSDPTQLSFISDSHSEAKTLANIALNYISVKGTTDSAFRAYFGNTNSPQPAAVFTVGPGHPEFQQHFSDGTYIQAVVNENSPSLLLSCTDPLSRCGSGITYTNAGNIYGEVFPLRLQTIYAAARQPHRGWCESSRFHVFSYATVTPSYCPSFFNTLDTAQLCSREPYDPSGIRGTVTLFGLTSLLSGTGQYAQAPQCWAAQQLVLDDPDLALQNGDNYNCFAMWAYVQTQC